MTPHKEPGRLSSIQTLWTVLRQAHDGPADEAARARAQLWQRYAGAVHRYLRALVADPHQADDLAQEFAVCLLKGEFRQADPQFGRFRNYVKAVLRNLVARARKAQPPAPVSPHSPALLELPAGAEDDRDFDQAWRDGVLARAWQALAEAHREWHAVLEFRRAHPLMPSHQMAEQLAPLLGKAVTAAGVRQALRRGRRRLGELLREEVAQSLDCPTAEEVDDELRELGLLGYCQQGEE